MAPPIVAPTGYPVACRLMFVLRHLSEEYSDVMTPMLASMPPMPRPVSTRSAVSCTRFRAAAEASMPVVMRPRQNRISARLP